MGVTAPEIGRGKALYSTQAKFLHLWQHYLLYSLKEPSYVDFPGGSSGKEPTCQSKRCKRLRFNPWVRKIFYRRTLQPTPVYFPRESWWATAHRVEKSWTQLKQLSTCTHAHTHTHTHTHTYGSSYIIADGDCCHEIKRHVLLGRKAVTNLDSILKSRDIT